MTVITLGDLTSRARAIPEAEAAHLGTIRLESDEDAAVCLVYFAQDPDRDRIRLVVQGQEVGCLFRSDIYALFPTQGKGVDDSAGFRLPGQGSGRSYQLFQFACPVDGCPDSPIFTTFFDENAPPRCRVHPDRELIHQP